MVLPPLDRRPIVLWGGPTVKATRLAAPWMISRRAKTLRCAEHRSSRAPRCRTPCLSRTWARGAVASLLPPATAMNNTTVDVDVDKSREGEPIRLGGLFVGEKVVEPAQLEEALRIQQRGEVYAPLGHILVAQKIITRDQLLSVLERHRRSGKLGDILLKNGELDRTPLHAALTEHRRAGQPLGEVVIRLGLISEERLRQALCRQLHIRFFNLDAIIIEPGLRKLVNEKFAMKHRLVPLARLGNLLIVAMDDPTQTQFVDDLQRTAGLKIEIVTS